MYTNRQLAFFLDADWRLVSKTIAGFIRLASSGTRLVVE